MKELNDIDTMERLYYLWILMDQTTRAIQKARLKELSKYNMKATQAGILFAVDKLGHRATPATISRFMFQEPQSTSEMITKMAEESLLIKTKGGSKKNTILIELTDKGRKLLEKSSKRKSIYTILSTLPEKDQQQFWSYLLVLREKALKLSGTERKIIIELDKHR